MPQRDLRLVTRVPPAASRERVLPLAVAATLAAIAAAATVLGADADRRPFDAAQIRRAAFDNVALDGRDAPSVDSARAAFERRLRLRPLDARARAELAALDLATAGGVEDLERAARRASAAARIAPVTVPVVRRAAEVLAASGHARQARLLVRDMFAYDDTAAARLLERLAPFLESDPLDALPETPEAHAAWALRIYASGETARADRWVRDAVERWPTSDRLVELAAGVARREARWDELMRLFRDFDPESTRRHAGLIALRGLAAAHLGDREGALRDVAAATRQGRGIAGVWLTIGDVHDALGDEENARRAWARGEFVADDKTPRGTRRDLAVRLARLEERLGRPADARRAWKRVLEIDPGFGEALRRVAGP